MRKANGNGLAGRGTNLHVGEVLCLSDGTRPQRGQSTLRSLFSVNRGDCNHRGVLLAKHW